MTTALRSPRSTITDSSDRNARVRAEKIRFVTRCPRTITALRKYKQPRRAFAITSSEQLDDLAALRKIPTSTDKCHVVFLLKNLDAGKLSEFDQRLQESEEADALSRIVFEQAGEVIQWRPGCAVVQCRPEREFEILRALADFAFYEGEVRALEAVIAEQQPQAEADVACAYKIEQRDKREWKRLQQCTKFFAKMRLIYARLEPQLAEPSRTLPVRSQRMVAALVQEADIEHRLEALDERLEALEDLYEGATDRIADYGWYREGSWMELIIILLLVIETVIVAIEVALHHH